MRIALAAVTAARAICSSQPFVATGGQWDEVKDRWASSEVSVRSERRPGGASQGGGGSRPGADDNAARRPMGAAR
ncbi:hypothetical protein FB559_1907 [Actinoallomurus bryophytorum]|uniref:Uncharacterized protein n=1 Tax=Actinoallomurus bryophytorum TaxID=1490222 RepID=A0A543CH95_9ACTN|nr:hypothetical protein FB559_1907 [Actinoallomurus bryophytorum]